MTTRIRSGTYAADVVKVLSQDKWMDNQDVKARLGWGPDDSASSVLSDMYTRTCPGCIERREKPPDRRDGAKYEYRLSKEPNII